MERGEKKMKEALIIIDMLNDFIKKDGSLYCGGEAEKIVSAIQKEIASFRKKRMPVVYVCDQHLPSDLEFKMFPKHCQVGSKGAKIISELSPQKEDFVIPKRRFSAFFQTDLDLTLRELGVGRLVLVGVCTNICLLYTAADARMRNYKVTILKNCVASFDLSAHKFALSEMEKTLGCVVRAKSP